MTVCSGIEAVSLAWEPLGMKPVAFSEIEDFPNRVLAHHWPEVPNLGDMTAIDGSAYHDIDILWGSTPCQAFSLAGLRAGTSDPRGALALSFCRLADEIDPPFICWENVKGVLSDRKTNAFGCLLGALAGEDTELVPPGEKWSHAGYVLGPKRAIAWRLFDAQYSGIPQRRQRVFLVACPRGGADPRQILFEQGSGYKAPNRKAERPRQASTEKQAFAVAFRGRDGGEAMEVGGSISNCLLASQGGSDRAYVLIDDGIDPHVRLLTPLECERVMGIPPTHVEINTRCYIDHLNNFVIVDNRCLKSQNNALRVDSGASKERVLSVSQISNTCHQDHEKHVVLYARVCLDKKEVRILNPEKSPENAKNADWNVYTLHPEQIDVFVQFLVQQKQLKEQGVDFGKAGLLLPETSFTHRENGQEQNKLFGPETKEHVNDAIKNTETVTTHSTCTTFSVGQSFQNVDYHSITSFYSVVNAIVGFIPHKMGEAYSFDLNLVIEAGHTAVSGTELASDSLRYKAIGNSIAVTDVRWIGEQLLKNTETKITVW